MSATFAQVLTAASALATLITMIIAAVKGIRYMSRLDDRVQQLWESIMGEGPLDAESFFSRFGRIETRVDEIWRRLDFDKLPHQSPRRPH